MIKWKIFIFKANYYPRVNCLLIAYRCSGNYAFVLVTEWKQIAGDILHISPYLIPIPAQQFLTAMELKFLKSAQPAASSR